MLESLEPTAVLFLTTVIVILLLYITIIADGITDGSLNTINIINPSGGEKGNINSVVA